MKDRNEWTERTYEKVFIIGRQPSYENAQSKAAKRGEPKSWFRG